MTGSAPPPFAGAVLCGGAGRRMGEDKARLELDGVSLLERCITRLRGAGAAPVLVASRLGDIRAAGCLSVADAVPGRGPLGGLVGVLRTGPADLCALVAVDMPDLSPALLRLLATLWRGEDAVVPVSSRGPEPLHALYAASALPHAELRLSSEDISLRGLLAGLRVRFVDVATQLDPQTAASFAVNLNRPEEVAEWRRQHPAAGPPQPG